MDIGQKCPIESKRITMENKSAITEVTLEAERQLLGSIIIAPFVMDGIRGIIEPYDFIGGKNSQHGRIYAAMVQCENPDIASTSYKMVETDYIDDDDIFEMRECYAGCFSHIDWEYYRDAVLKYSVTRYSEYFLSKNEPAKAQRMLNRLKPKVTGGVVVKEIPVINTLRNGEFDSDIIDF